MNVTFRNIRKRVERSYVYKDQISSRNCLDGISKYLKAYNDSHVAWTRFYIHISLHKEVRVGPRAELIHQSHAAVLES